MDTAHIKRRLEEEKEKLETGMQSVGRKSTVVPNDWEAAPAEEGREADPVDQAEVIATRENDAAVLEALESQYDSILAALSRIDAGTFGLCEECSAPIADARLEANPSATTCALHMQ
ncbi:MAG: TraR/DksA C4-type zinc finger protein [Candidatus Paceibacterota bacterium]